MLLTSAATILGAAAPDGAAIFTARCVQCHQADATGADGLAPSLAGTLQPYLATPDGRQYLSQIAISGMAGRIESQGRIIVGMMPSFKPDLSDAEITAVLNYVLANYNASPGNPVTEASVTAARKAAPTPIETRKLREKIKAATK